MSRAQAPKKLTREKLSVFSPLVAFGLTAYDLTLSPPPERLEQATFAFINN